jgi:hypothetical protein
MWGNSWRFAPLARRLGRAAVRSGPGAMGVRSSPSQCPADGGWPAGRGIAYK